MSLRAGEVEDDVDVMAGVRVVRVNLGFEMVIKREREQMGTAEGWIARSTSSLAHQANNKKNNIPISCQGHHVYHSSP
jgi:hypothetical protein